MIKLSVIVPIYNTAPYLRKTLDSLANQTFKDFEVLLINDGSTDQSKEIMEEYTRKYPFMKAYHLENHGVSYARNFGISKAKGKYLTFLDSDDYIDLDLYEKMYEKTKGNVDVVECDFIWEYEKKVRYDHLDLTIHPLLAMRAVVWNRFYKRELLTKNNLTFPLNVYYEDVEFCYKVFPFIKTFAYVKDSYVHYVQREGSITSQKTKKMKDIYQVLDQTIEFYQKNGFYDQYEKELEYLYTRYLLGSSFLRMVKVKSYKLRKEMLKENFQKLKEKYPNYQKNIYIKKKNKKNLYFQSVNKITYPIYREFFHFFAK